MRKQQIRTNSDYSSDTINIWGWLDGKQTYLAFGTKDHSNIGSISGHRLYRLAKAIVRQFEESK